MSHRCGASRAALHVVWSDDNVPRSRASVVQRKSRACSQTEHLAMFHDNAVRVYRLELRA